MSDRLRALTGVGPTPDPATELPPDEEPGTSERTGPPEDAQSPLHPRSEATGAVPKEQLREPEHGE